MKKTAVVILPLLLAGGLLVKIGFATFPGKPYLVSKCEVVAKEIEQVMTAHANDACAGDLAIAAAYVKAAGLKISHEKPELALTAMTYAAQELHAIVNSRAYCRKLAEPSQPLTAHTLALSEAMKGALAIAKRLPKPRAGTMIEKGLQ
jgi:hypothetical protein